MPSTEFLLYLIIVIFVVFVIMNYYKDNNTNEPQIQYKYIPVYSESDNSSRSDNASKIKNKHNDYENNNGINIVDVNSEGNYGGPYDGPYGGGYGGPGRPYPGPPGPPGPPGIPGGPGIPPIDPLRKFDYDAVNDDFTPPFRRSYYDDYGNYRYPPGMAPIYSRGPPGRFRKVGMLIAQGVAATDPYKFLSMMGREKYPGREYEYFASSPNTEQTIKFYIDTKGREISDGDLVNIDSLEGYSFKFKEDPDLSPRYDPYMI
jgi:hypothetical protein